MIAENTVNEAPILVLGGTGKTGRRVAERLAARGLPVRVGSRAAQPPFDWNDESTWAPALRGAAAVYISYYPDIAIPGAVEAVRRLAALAVDNHVSRLVLLSGRGEDEAQRAERVVQASGADWTIVRCSWFNQNFSENYLLEPLLAGEVVLPAGDVPEPFVDADDIADVAVAALTDDSHMGKVYELTGPRLLTFEQAVAEIAAAAGRAIRFVPISVDEYGSELVQISVPDDDLWLLTYLFKEVLDGRNAYLADGVRQALGRAPRDFSDYVCATAATGVWQS